MSIAIVAAARAVVGARFRLHGRDPELGLDCVGLVAVALRGGGADVVVPTGYALRSGDVTMVSAMLRAAGLALAKGAQPGDILLCQAGPGQVHLAIAAGPPGTARTSEGVIHADAQLRRVVERPGPIPWPVISRWRVFQQEE